MEQSGQDIKHKAQGDEDTNHYTGNKRSLICLTLFPKQCKFIRFVVLDHHCTEEGSQYCKYDSGRYHMRPNAWNPFFGKGNKCCNAQNAYGYA